LFDRLDTFATETFHFKDILDPIMIGLMIPPPAIHGLELRSGVPPGIEQVGAEHFHFATREPHFK